MSSAVAPLSVPSGAQLSARTARVLWALLLISIPVTSFPWIARLTGLSTVSPLAGVPLLLLALTWGLPYWRRGGPIPKGALPFLVFLGAALLASAVAFFLPIRPFLGQEAPGREARALITLAIGAGFYLLTACYARREHMLLETLRWISLGSIPMLLWASVQAGILFLNFPITSLLMGIHRFFSIRDMLFPRVTGLAYEPSWLADQMVMLYLPLWIGCVFKGVSAFRWRWKGVTLEAGLLAWGSVILFLSVSRIGMLSALAIAGGLLLTAGWRLTAHESILPRRRRPGAAPPGRSVARRLLTLALMFLLLLVLAVALVYLASRFDDRLQRIFETDYLDLLRTSEDPVYSLANRLAYAERVMYWASGLRTFSLHPVLGVGLGNSGFLFESTVPAFGYRLPEIVDILGGEGSYPNPKSLWVRVLAETGIVGFGCLVGWLVVLATSAVGLARTRGPSGVIGLACSLALLALVFEGLSLDTFALPQLWVLPGLVAAASALEPAASPRPMSMGT